MLKRLGWGNRPQIESHDIVTAAMRQSGSDRFGAATWNEPLEVLCRSLNDEARLTPAGRRWARTMLIQRMLDRAVQHEHSDTAVNVDAWIVTGVDDAAVQALTTSLRHFLVPTSKAAPYPALSAEFAAIEDEFDAHLPSFAEWLAEADLTEAYLSAFARLRNVSPAGPLVVGSIQHLEQLRALSSAAPGATIVRLSDPAVPAGSESTFEDIVHRRRRWSNDVDADKVIRYWRWRSQVLTDRYDAARADLGGTTTLRFLDVDIGDVRSDADSAAERVVAHR